MAEHLWRLKMYTEALWTMEIWLEFRIGFWLLKCGTRDQRLECGT